MIRQANIVQIQQEAQTVISRLDNEISQVRASIQDSQDKLQAITLNDDMLKENKKLSEEKEDAEKNLASALEAINQLRTMAEKANQGQNHLVVRIDDEGSFISDLQNTVVDISAKIQKLKTEFELTIIEQTFLNKKRFKDGVVLAQKLAKRKELLELTEQLSKIQSAINDLEEKLALLSNKAHEKQALHLRKEKIEKDLANINKTIQAIQALAEQTNLLFKKNLVNIQDGAGKLALETELKDIESKIEALSQALIHIDSLKQNLQDYQARLKDTFLKLENMLIELEQPSKAVQDVNITPKESGSVSTFVQRDSNCHTSAKRTSPNSHTRSAPRQSPPVIDPIEASVNATLRVATTLYYTAWEKYERDNNIDHLDVVTTHLSNAINNFVRTKKSAGKKPRTSPNRDSVVQREIDYLRQNIFAILGIKLAELYGAKQYSKCMKTMALIKHYYDKFGSQQMSGTSIPEFSTIHMKIKFYHAGAALQEAISYFQNNNVIIKSDNGEISLNPDALNKLLSDNASVAPMNAELQKLEEACNNYKSLLGNPDYVSSTEPQPEPQQCIVMICLLYHGIGNYFYKNADFTKLKNSLHRDYLLNACRAFSILLMFKAPILTMKVLTQDEIARVENHLVCGKRELNLPRNNPSRDASSSSSSTSSRRPLTPDFDRRAASGLAPAVLDDSMPPPLEDPNAIAAPAADGSKSISRKRKTMANGDR